MLRTSADTRMIPAWRRRLTLLSAVLSFCLAARGGAQQAQDTVYVQGSVSGRFSATTGTIVEVTPAYLIIVKDGTPELLTREVVRNVRLLGDGVERDRMRATIAGYWIWDTPVIVQMVQSLPLIGQELKFLDRTSPTTAKMISFVLLIGACGWGAFKFHDIVIVARETQRLNRMKLEYDLAKARFEALSLSGGASEGDRAALRAVIPQAVIPADARVSDRISLPVREAPSLPPSPIVRLGSRLISAKAMRERKESLLLQWAVALKEGEQYAARKYRWKWIGYRVRHALLWIYGPFFLFMTPFMVFVGTGEAERESFGVGVSYAAIGLLCSYFLLRSKVTWHLIESTYQEAQATHRGEVTPTMAGARSPAELSPAH